jgi:hypothetical protein
MFLGHFNLYIVKSNNDSFWQSRGLLHTITSDHLLTWQVNPGDEIIYRIPCYLEKGEDGVYHLRIDLLVELPPDLGNPEKPVWNRKGFLKITTHLGRPVALGEDGCENAYGHNFFDYFLVQHRRAPGLDLRELEYIPCSVECIPADTLDDDEYKKAVYQECFEFRSQWERPMKWKVTSDTWYSHDCEIYPTYAEAKARAAELQAALDEKIEEDREAQRDDFGNLPPLTNWQADRHFFVSPAEEEEDG